MRYFFSFIFLFCVGGLVFSQNQSSIKNMSDQQKFMEAYDMLASLAKKNPLMSKLWTDAQMTLLKEAKEVYFALKNETADDSKAKVQTVAYKKPNPDLSPDPDEDIDETPFIDAIEKWISAFLLELNKKGLDKGRWQQKNVMPFFQSKTRPIVPIIGEAINNITNSETRTNPDNNGLPLADTTQEKSKYQKIEAALQSFTNEFLSEHYKSNKKAYKEISELGLPNVADLVSLLVPEKVENNKTDEKPNKEAEEAKNAEAEKRAKEKALSDFQNTALSWANGVHDAMFNAVLAAGEYATFNSSAILKEIIAICNTEEELQYIGSENKNCPGYAQEFHKHIINKISKNNFTKPEAVTRQELSKALALQDFQIDSAGATTKALLDSLKTKSLHEFQMLLDKIKADFSSSSRYTSIISSNMKKNENIADIAGADEEGLYTFETLPQVVFQTKIIVGTGDRWVPSWEANMGVELDLVIVCDKTIGQFDEQLMPFYKISSITASGWSNNLFEDKGNTSVTIPNISPKRVDGGVITEYPAIDLGQLTLKKSKADSTGWSANGNLWQFSGGYNESVQITETKISYDIKLVIKATVGCNNKRGNLVTVGLQLDWATDWASKMRTVEFIPLQYKNKFPFYKIEQDKDKVYPIKK